MDLEIRQAANFLTVGDWEPSDAKLRKACRELRHGGWKPSEVHRKTRNKANWPNKADTRMLTIVNMIDIHMDSIRGYCRTWEED